MNIWSSKNERRFLSDANWRLPEKWNKQAELDGTTARVFCASMGDLFEWKRGLTKQREKLWSLVEKTPSLNWLLLTKRPHLVARLVPWTSGWPANVWIGATVENQKWVDKRLPFLTALPTENVFLSCEPLLDEISLTPWLEQDVVSWVIAGGESGGNARPSEPHWFYALRDECVEWGVPFHFKQWGVWAPTSAVEGPIPRRRIDIGFSTPMGRYPKSISGRVLDGEIWDELPTALQ